MDNKNKELRNCAICVNASTRRRLRTFASEHDMTIGTLVQTIVDRYLDEMDEEGVTAHV